jgi:glycosyltransferase involved in cell wall biosynthesis
MNPRPNQPPQSEPSALHRLGTEDLEGRIADPRPLGHIDTVVQRDTDAASRIWPSLASLLPAAGSGSLAHRKICIASDDIAGPTRNGGIGSTYAWLAELLARDGHDVTLLYLKGRSVENETIEHWITHFEARGVRLVPVPNYTVEDRFVTPETRWLKPSYNLLRYLLDHPMDVVHVSEWQAAGFLSLMAKRQGIALQATSFIVKASSPWLWNRLYGQCPLTEATDLTQTYAERCSIEWADMVVGGSAHLLRFMAAQGYRLPAGRTFVQPNVISIAALAEHTATATARGGQRVPVDTFVFFGRLEARKGLVEFCRAVRRLVRTGQALPKRVIFLGKPGDPLPGSTESVMEWLRSETADWPMPVEFVTTLQTAASVAFLLAGPRLAVMPSLIENSSLAVYETALCGVPLVASDVGGNAELLHPADAAEVLCPAHPVPLADTLADALLRGGLVARPSFDNGNNLDIWRALHRLPLPAAEARASVAKPSLTVALHARNLSDLDASLSALVAQAPSISETLIGFEARTATDLQAATDHITQRYPSLQCRLLDTSDHGLGSTYNRLAAEATGDMIIFLTAGMGVLPGALEAFRALSATTGADLLTCFERVITSGQSELRAHLPGSLGMSFFNGNQDPFPLAVRRSVLRDIAFASDLAPGGIMQEFVTTAQLRLLRVETILYECVRRNDLGNATRAHAVQAGMVAVRPHLAAAPLAMRDLLMRAKGFPSRPMASHRVARTARPTGASTPRAGHPQLAGDPITPAQPAPVVPAFPAHPGLPPDLESHCDGILGDRLCGWLWAPHEPDQRFYVTLLIDGAVHTTQSVTVLADLHRMDLEEAGIGFGDCAYAISLPSRVLAGEGQRIEIALTATGSYLPGSCFIRGPHGFSRKQTSISPWRRVLRSLKV